MRVSRRELSDYSCSVINIMSSGLVMITCDNAAYVCIAGVPGIRTGWQSVEGTKGEPGALYLLKGICSRVCPRHSRTARLQSGLFDGRSRTTVGLRRRPQEAPVDMIHDQYSRRSQRPSEPRGTGLIQQILNGAPAKNKTNSTVPAILHPSYGMSQ